MLVVIVNVKLSLYTPARRGGVYVYADTFLFLELDGSAWSDSVSAALPLGKEHRVPAISGWVGSRAATGTLSNRTTFPKSCSP